jgi:hypothetical protein
MITSTTMLFRARVTVLNDVLDDLRLPTKKLLAGCIFRGQILQSISSFFRTAYRGPAPREVAPVCKSHRVL